MRYSKGRTEGRGGEGKDADYGLMGGLSFSWKAYIKYRLSYFLTKIYGNLKVSLYAKDKVQNSGNSVSCARWRRYEI